MKTNPLTTLTTALALSFGLVATACGNGGPDNANPGATPDATANVDIDFASLRGTLNGSGASFPDPLQQAVIGEFRTVAPNLRVNYAKSGSSAGKADLAGNVVQFAGTDSLVKEEEAEKMRGEFLYIPITAAPITVSYNLPGVEDLRLSPELLAKIFQTEVTSWDDPAIAEVNPDADLPSTPIAVVRRSDGSGTTNNFTKYLTKAAPDVWKLGSGDSIEWPATTQGAEKSGGVSSLIASTPGAIGYVDLADSVSAGLQRAAVRNAAGNWVDPVLPAASAALDGAEVNDDLTLDPLDSPDPDAYPITAASWVIAYVEQPSEEVASALKGYLSFLLTRGQQIAPTVGYAPLPAELQERALAQLDRIVVA